VACTGVASQAPNFSCGVGIIFSSLGLLGFKLHLGPPQMKEGCCWGFFNVWIKIRGIEPGARTVALFT